MHIPRRTLVVTFGLALGCALLVYSQTTVQVGYLTVTADAGTSVPVGTALFSYSNSAGVLVSQAAVGAAAPILLGRIFVDGTGTATGLALVNSSGRPASVVFILRDAAGSEVSRQSQTLAAGQHLSRYVTQLFPNLPAGFTGSLTIESDSPLAALTLRDSPNSRGENLYTTLPVVDLASSSNDPVIFPQVAAGGGYTTQLILVNRSGQRISGVVRLTGDDGRALPLKMGSSTGSVFPYQIEPNGVYRGELEGSLEVSVGYATAAPDPGNSAPAGVAIFQYKPGGRIVSEAGVAATAQTTLARVFVDHVASRTGLALANPGNSAATLDLTLMDRYGGAVAPASFILPAGGHRSVFVDELFKGEAREGFTGLVEIRSSVPIAPITLKVTTNTRDETILTTLPVADLTRIPSATSIIFPHIALYGSYSTRLIFIHPDRANASSGRLQFYAEDGTPLTIPMTGQRSSGFSYRFSAGSARQFRPGNTDGIAKIDLLDAANTSTTEFPINEGNKARPPLGIRDTTGAVRDDFDVVYASSNPDVATVDDGVITAKVRGFSTLTIAFGGVVKAAVITVTSVDAGGSGFGASPSGVKPTPEGLYLTSADQQTVLLTESVTSTPLVYAGTQGVSGLKNGPRLQSQFSNPSFVEKGRYDKTLYVSDAANNVIRRIQPGSDGRVETLAGTGAPGSANGTTAEATFRNPKGIAQDDRGLIWVADSDNHTIRRINLSSGLVETIAGAAGIPGLTDGQRTAARFRSPMGITVEPEGLQQQSQRERRGQPPPPVRVIVADAGNNALRRVYEDGRVETIAGGAGVPLALNAPADVAADAFGTIYLTEPGAKQVRAVLPNGDVVAVAEPKTFSQPQGIAVSQSGRIVVGDTRLREIRYGGPQITSITPNRISSRPGAKVTIQGRNFAPGSLIVAGDVIITSIAAAGSNTETISLVMPALPSGRTTLTVQNRGGLDQIPLLVDAVPLNELPVGSITTVAGGSTYAGDGGPAVLAPVTPSSIVVDSSGNLLIADTSNHRIRRVDAKSGIITSVAGNGQYGFSGDGGPAVAAALNTPFGITLDAAGNLYISDSYNERVRRVDARTGIIQTVAGTGEGGYSGDGGPATAANLYLPTGLAVDDAGNLFIADAYNNRIRRVDSGGTITTVAGDGQRRFAGDNGSALNASLSEPGGIFVDRSGNLFLADTDNNRIRKVDRNGIITTVAGNGAYGSSDEGTPALAAMLANATDVTGDADGNLFIADYNSGRIRKVSVVDSRMTTVAGNGNFDFSGDGGPATAAGMKQARSVAVDTGGNIFVADSENRNVRRVDKKTGIISTVAGNREGAFLGENGPATFAVINYPLAVTFDSAGNLIIGDSDNRVRKVDPNGIVTIIAGGGAPPDGLGDNGPATEADLSQPSGLAFDRAGNLYIADAGHSRVRKVDARTRIITTAAGTGQESFYGDGGPATGAALRYPRTLAIDSNDNLYISDEGNVRIRKVNLTSGMISTYAGTGTLGLSGDGGPADRATFSAVWSFVMDPAGNIYIADYDNARIRRIDRATESVSTFAAGTAEMGILPISVAFDGRLYVMDLIRQSVLRIEANGAMTVITGNGEAGFSGDNGPGSAASISYPAAMAFDRSGNLFIADSNNNRIRAVRGPIP